MMIVAESRHGITICPSISWSAEAHVKRKLLLYTTIHTHNNRIAKNIDLFSYWSIIIHYFESAAFASFISTPALR